MNILLAVDPGTRGCGVALFRNDVLFACAYVKNPERAGSDFFEVMALAHEVRRWSADHTPTTTEFGFPGRLVLEWPRVYTASKSKGDNNDLMPLVAVDAAVVALLGAPARRVYPHEWKGTLTKEQTRARIESRLSPGERVAYDEGVRVARSLAHNMIDAVGIGLHALGRMAPRKVLVIDDG